MSMGDSFDLRNEEVVPNGVTLQVDFVWRMEFDDQKWSLKVPFQVERNRGHKIGKQPRLFYSILHYKPSVYHTALHLSGGQRIVFK